MIDIKVSKQGNFPIKATLIKNKLREFFVNNGIVSDSVCYVSLVSEVKMKEIGKKYYKKDDRIHNVFSFVESEVKNFTTKSGLSLSWQYPDQNKIHLGEIIVCYPICVQEAQKEGKLIDDKIVELVTHSALHLMGIHHKE